VNLEERIVAIGFAGEQGLDFAALNLGSKGSQRRLGVFHDFLVVLLLAELDEPSRVVQTGIELGIGR
jgi:hypothetical protein